VFPVRKEQNVNYLKQFVLQGVKCTWNHGVGVGVSVYKTSTTVKA
jgi:hypothetical protein